jgi:hypothetical protein
MPKEKGYTGKMWNMRMPVIALPGLFVLERTNVRFGSTAVILTQNDRPAANPSTPAGRTRFRGNAWLDRQLLLIAVARTATR